MRSQLQGAAVVLLVAAGLVYPAPPEAVKPGRPAKPPAAPKQPKAPQKLNDPGGSVAQRLLQMTPEQRERALEKFPPERQAQIRQRLEKLDSLPPQQRQRLAQNYITFSNLPPAKQALVRRQIRAFNQLPDDRKQVVGVELQRLRKLPASERENRMGSGEFKNRFTPAEQQMMADISENMPLR
ncbi:MAG: DUF3106 domain-containing protein [Acidobacteriia bacterium]|nr:DUF3106 domain-containing protein [Terriglobia bacterium]